MEEKLREIVAPFLKVAADQIGAATPIDRQAVKSSIVLHRMYARLAEEGFVYRDYVSIRVFGDLLGAPAPAERPAAPAAEPVADPIGREASGEPIAMGIDIESIEALPRVTDFRRDPFYTMNFTPREIAYCILQADPYSSFAGLFAAKEALIKADGSLRERPLHQMEIGHEPEGKPLYPGFTLSIAHANGTAVAVAARGGNSVVLPQLSSPAGPADGRRSGGSALAWLAVLLATAALLIVLLR